MIRKGTHSTICIYIYNNNYSEMTLMHHKNLQQNKLRIKIGKKT